MQTAYVSATQIPQVLRRQGTYAVDSLGQPIMNHDYIPNMIPTPGQPHGYPMGQHIPQGIILPANHPLQVLSHHPGYPHQQYGGAYMTQSGIMHTPLAGDISTPPYLERDMPQFPRQYRGRPSNIAGSQGMPVIPLGMGGHYLSQSGMERESPYFMECQFCQAGHPGWHPSTTPIHMVPRNMPGMEDSMSMTSISSMALSHPSQQAMYDPADHPWPSTKLLRGRDPARDFYTRGLKRSGSINGREIPGGFPRFHEIPDSDAEGNEDEDNGDRDSRPSLSSLNLGRQRSRRNLRSSSRTRSSSGYP